MFYPPDSGPYGGEASQIPSKRRCIKWHPAAACPACGYNPSRRRIFSPANIQPFYGLPVTRSSAAADLY